MKPCITSVWIILVLIFLITGKAFPQSIENKNTTTVTTQSDVSSQYVKGITAGRARALVGVAWG